MKKYVKFEDIEIPPYWVWIILILFNVIIYKIVGFELGLLTAIWILLWYKIVIESENHKRSRR